MIEQLQDEIGLRAEQVENLPVPYRVLERNALRWRLAAMAEAAVLFGARVALLLYIAVCAWIPGWLWYAWPDARPLERLALAAYAAVILFAVIKIGLMAARGLRPPPPRGPDQVIEVHHVHRNGSGNG